MRLYEHEAKQLLARFDIDTPRSQLVTEPGEAESATRHLGNHVVVKGQYLSGGRMKAGAVRFAETPDEPASAARAIFDVEVAGQRPASLLIEERLPVDVEFYAGIVFDNDAGGPRLLVSRDGGIEVETANPAARGTVLLSNLLPTQLFRVKEALADSGVTGPELVDLATIVSRLHSAVLEHDLLLAEINPLARLGDGRWVALDAHIEVDDDALFRQQPLLQELGIANTNRSAREATPLEDAASRIDRSDHRGVAGRVVEFEGRLGLLIGGGGASLTAFDAVRRHGGKPANYCEIGGNPSVRKVAELTTLLLSKPGVDRIAVIMNVVNNTRADMIARGVIKGCLAAGREPAEAIAVFRIPGAWEDEASRLLRHYGIEPAGREVSIDEAARRAVEAVPPA